MDIEEHGVCEEKVECNYCKKQMSTFSSLRYHLGGVGKEVAPCEQVPDVIRVKLQKMLTKGSCGMETDGKVKCVVDGEMSDARVLNGCMFQEEALKLKEVQGYVNKVKDSWTVTGCSILLDAWVDKNGRDVVAFVADCPAGPVYLKSLDVTEIKNDSSALMSLVDGVIDEVGTHNVVQIVASSSSGWVGELGKAFVDNEKGVFWAVSVSHCFERMLVKIAKIYFNGDMFDKVNKITEFINNNPSVLKLVEKASSHGLDMVVFASEFDFVTPYLTLEGIFKAKNDLAIASSVWNKEAEGVATISNLVNDSSFWETVEKVVKCASILICGLHMITSVNNQHIGYVYDTMDSIKESVASEFNDKKVWYMPLWDVIDDVWNDHLHIPLHAAGYFLNPTSYYSKDFHLDEEVASDLITSLVTLVKECDTQVKVATQIDSYRLGQDCFEEASLADSVSGVSPAEWWTKKASEFPELQSFAVKILSQTCDGASRYKLRSLPEEHHLEELAFVHYNLHLQSYTAKVSEES